MICMPIHKTIPDCSDYYSFILSFEIRQPKFFSFVLLLQNCFVYFKSFVCPYKFQYQLVDLSKKIGWDFDSDLIESLCHLERNYCITIIETSNPWMCYVSVFIQLFFKFPHIYNNILQFKYTGLKILLVNLFILHIHIIFLMFLGSYFLIIFFKRF